MAGRHNSRAIRNNYINWKKENAGEIISSLQKFVPPKLENSISPAPLSVCSSNLSLSRLFNKVYKSAEITSAVKNIQKRRGHVVPVLDLSLKFGMPATEKTVNTCIIIVED